MVANADTRRPERQEVPPDAASMPQPDTGIPSGDPIHEEMPQRTAQPPAEADPQVRGEIAGALSAQAAAFAAVMERHSAIVADLLIEIRDSRIDIAAREAALAARYDRVLGAQERQAEILAQALVAMSPVGKVAASAPRNGLSSTAADAVAAVISVVVEGGHPEAVRKASKPSVKAPAKSPPKAPAKPSAMVPAKAAGKGSANHKAARPIARKRQAEAGRKVSARAAERP
jgi:hypothetical protein